jgi:hypothetical protein
MVENPSQRPPVYGREHAAARTPEPRERQAEARRAAEALFAPKAPLTKQPIDLPSPAPPPEPSGGEPQPSNMIPAAHVPRIRAWLKYGMTIAQVAAVYGVAVAELEGLLRRGN